MTNWDKIAQVFESGGGARYYGEKITQLDHALQAAWLAEREGAADSLVVAALLHDIGHVLHGLPEDIADQDVDGRHEAIGAAWLAHFFGPEVTAPVGLHVPAKRYLCATEPQYFAGLSPSSVQSLRLQGGPMSLAEIEEFEKGSHWREGVRLRRWDDAAKIEGLAVPGLAHYRRRAEALMKPARSAS